MQIIGKKMTSKINLILLERHALISLSYDKKTSAPDHRNTVLLFMLKIKWPQNTF